MVNFADIKEFIDGLDDINNMQMLQEYFTAGIKPLGFDKHTCLSLVDMNNPPANAIMLFAFPEAWVAHYKDERYYEDDVVLKSIFRSIRPCLWGELTRLDFRNQQIFSEAQEFGIRNGMTIPLLLPGYYPTTINIAGDHPDVDPLAYHALHLMAVHYHHTVIRISSAGLRLPVLSTQQTQCLIWAARGKSDHDIGQILTIAPRTVNHHIERVREKLAVRTRAQAIALAITCGLITP
ncbi:LuxR family transcriptional regulator [Paremcibacter congregatus]|uniref:LuxR family transcriptional regulator n=1 Tax=Paremcibacter congregatus TaxID=2043170 RepID=UPI0030EF93C8|tara:strand:+ start:829 stop:1536 length:708 start_codon:yes stop_codon:yes gene_type:complete